jgi:leucyl aminopeptidase
MMMPISAMSSSRLLSAPCLCPMVASRPEPQQGISPPVADIFLDSAPGAIPVTALSKGALAAWLAGQPAAVAAWVAGAGFKADRGAVLAVPGPEGAPARVLLGLGNGEGAEEGGWSHGGLALTLPEGAYRLDAPLPGGPSATEAAIGWALGSYRFTRYRKADRGPARLLWPEGADRRLVQSTVAATFLVRDLVNTPAADLGPGELAAAAVALGEDFGAKVEVTEGEALLAANYPAVHAVGRASARAPRLIDLRWGDPAHPKVTLVGKGVCFDSGGLDLKPSSGMLLMKKDMGGAAHALGVARMVMEGRLPVRLRVLIPAVENLVAGNAMRPLDVLATRKGLTVEVGNTDAEGRLILCDALAEADREGPALIVDFATLTGAARIALGPDLPAMFCNDEGTAAALLEAARAERDPLWRMPLWQPYARGLKSPVADTNNVADGSFAGAIIAALFLEKFVSRTTPWVHLDIFAWNNADRPGRPRGGEALSMRAVHRLIADRFAKA